jgi:hypothetical protein
LAESGIVGKSKNRRRTADGFLIFCYVLKLYSSLIKPPCCEEINRKCLKYIETQRALGPGSFLVSYWLETQREMHPWVSTFV